ncbi:GvpL/GvpF family gas vesicle protein [Streptomyces sp. JJ36]|uniref:GvpL/GvpF family gas vesicle protein n=1 Tax=Streptomyces sp. JJ36 TaxID=2736645 RepID=UPI001F1E9296|nr:GvpL/GvpF family gas vesicle protein [Streptomyces sp. JJ36]MCF6525390.1 GvpL/GvpF family gas vesicle protein [Streptomyces sp. JJ36]
MGEPEAAVYVYGIVPAARRPPAGLTGVGAPPLPVRTVTAGPLAAVVSGVPEKLRARRRDLLAHQEVLLALLDRGPVLPMRFGMVCRDSGALEDQLAAEEPAHLDALEEVGGRIEMNLKALPVQDSLPELVREDPGVRRLREEARRRPGYEANVRLGEAVARGLEQRAARAAAQAVGELSGLAVRTVDGPQVPGGVRNTSFLVERGSRRRFEETAGRLAQEHGHRAELRLAGPLPCYSFVVARTRAAGV